MRALVTGSSGSIGSALARALSHNMEVVGIDLVPGKYTSSVFDLQQIDKLRRCLETVDAIIHCAGLHAPHVGIASDGEFKRANVDVTSNLLNYSRPTSPFVFTSSTSVYGHALESTSGVVWIDERVQPSPRDIYDKTKLQAEQLVKAAASENRPTTVLRMSRCFPEVERVMALYRLYRGVDRRDVVLAHQLALERICGYAEYVISGPCVFSEADLPQLAVDPWSVVLSYYPRAAEMFKEKGWQPISRIDRVYSSSLAKEQLGYNARYGFMECLSSHHDPLPLVS